MSRSCRPSKQRPQRGAAALAVSMVLLFCMTLVVFFVNRSLLFEQKSSANQYRSTSAFEVAEAGLEWATAMVNSSARIDAACVPAAGGAGSFVERYAPRGGTPKDYAPPAGARAGCRISGGGVLACSCPPAGTVPALGASTDPGFTVRIDDESGDPDALRITSWGCINQAAACTDTAHTAGDATAQVSVTLKLRPILRAAPPAALTTGGWALVCGTLAITNESAAANGYLVNSGGHTQIGDDTYRTGSIDACGAGGHALTTTPGTPIANAIAANEASLTAMSGDSNAMFAAFFGTTLAQFVAAPSTCTVSDSTDLLAAYADPARRCRDFWIDADTDFGSGATLGSAADPVTLVSSSRMRFNGSSTIHGVIYSDSADWNDLDLGITATIRGAVVSRVDFRSSAGGSIVYDTDVLDRIRERGRLVRVPGSWRDFQ